MFFDLDGTLVDTELAAAASIEECLRSWGLHPTAEDGALIAGRTWAKTFDFLFDRYPIRVIREEAMRTVMAAYKRRLRAGVPEVPGAAVAVRALAAGGLGLALISGSMREEIQFSLDRLGLGPAFSLVLGAEDYARSKPAPDGYEKAARLLGAEPGSVLVFEDSSPGIAAARAAGMWVVAVTSTNHFAQDLSGAHEQVPDLTGVDVEWVSDLATRVMKG